MRIKTIIILLGMVLSTQAVANNTTCESLKVKFEGYFHVGKSNSAIKAKSSWVEIGKTWSEHDFQLSQVRLVSSLKDLKLILFKELPSFKFDLIQGEGFNYRSSLNFSDFIFNHLYEMPEANLEVFDSKGFVCTKKIILLAGD